MNYFLKGMSRNNAKFFLFIGAGVVWLVAIFDIVSSIRPPGLFNGKWFTATVILTIAGPIVLGGYHLISQKKKKSEAATILDVELRMEERREQEIMDILKENPQFVTHCYECIYFDNNLRHCSRKLSRKGANHRVREITVNDKKYCLYWDPDHGDELEDQ